MWCISPVMVIETFDEVTTAPKNDLISSYFGEELWLHNTKVKATDEWGYPQTLEIAKTVFFSAREDRERESAIDLTMLVVQTSKEDKVASLGIRWWLKVMWSWTFVVWNSLNHNRYLILNQANH